MEGNQNLNGIIPINKPKGMTSHDVVAKLRRILGTKKVGHTGTLDPEVSGVLPICVGKATRLSDYIMEMPKMYRGQITLGISTTTQDATGDIVEQKKVEGISEEQIRKTIQRFIGEIDQIPPMYSSVKVQGKKLYELAREGKVVERKSRKVMIYDLRIFQMELGIEHPTIDFEVTCSKGTYVRTLCVDIGEHLGYPAHMSKLIRIKSGSFFLQNSFTLEEVEEKTQQGRLTELIVSMTASLPNYKEIQLPDELIEAKVFNGQPLYLDTYLTYSGIIKILNSQGELVALYEKEKSETRAKPIKVFK